MDQQRHFSGWRCRNLGCQSYAGICQDDSGESDLGLWASDSIANAAEESEEAGICEDDSSESSLGLWASDGIGNAAEESEEEESSLDLWASGYEGNSDEEHKEAEAAARDEQLPVSDDEPELLAGWLRLAESHVEEASGWLESSVYESSDSSVTPVRTARRRSKTPSKQKPPVARPLRSQAPPGKEQA